MRIDKLLYLRGFVPSRTRAASLIAEGSVTADGRLIKKPSEDIPENALITVEESEALHYVGRGALKLRAALNSFGIDPGGMTAVDIGASTGGFTQCLLEGGAVKVFALDSGHGQLSPLLTGDGRVVSIEGFNARYLTEAVIGCRCDIAVMDVSFISQRLLYSAVSSVLKDDGIFISLIKPQFEAGREYIKKGGIVRDKDSHVRAVMSLFSESVLYGLYPHGLIKSPISGGDGNTEYLALFGKNPEIPAKTADIAFVKEVVYGI